jgi:integrase
VLTEISIKAAKPAPKPKKLADTQGLYLYIAPTGSKLWRLDYKFEGKRKTLSFGAWPKVTLSTARGLRDKAKAALVSEVDPAVPPKGSAHDSFKAVAMEWFAAQNWVPVYKGVTIRRFEGYVFDAIGDLKIGAIDPPTILKMLRAVEAKGVPDVAKRIRQHVGAIFRYAIATGRADRDPAADVREAMLPAPRVRHRAALKADEVCDFYRALRSYDGQRTTVDALELMMHTFVRTTELRLARWSEVGETEWRIPAERMKMRREHIVPLTDPALTILGRLKTKHEWVVATDAGRTISANTLIFAMYRMGYHSRATVHGFRGLASTVLNESGMWSPDAIERQLAHVPGDGVRSAYNAAQYLSERRRMMEWWSAWLEVKKVESLT